MIITKLVLAAAHLGDFTIIDILAFDETQQRLLLQLSNRGGLLPSQCQQAPHIFVALRELHIELTPTFDYQHV